MHDFTTQGDRPDISICTTVKNRSRVSVDGHQLELFPNCVNSIRKSIPSDLACELVVADWNSDDWPLTDWLKEAADPIPVTLLSLTGTFSRGHGRNMAGKHAKSDRLFFLDADCLICEPLLRRAIEILANNQAFFPVLYSFRDQQHQNGWWRHKGYGNCMILREAFEKVGGFPEYGYWGREDSDFFENVQKVQDVVREKVEDFFHQWHPNDFEWKNRYGEPSPIEELKATERRYTSIAVKEITEVVPAGQALILVDDSQLRAELPSELQTFHLLERDGEDWGLPEDSANAIAELERLRSLGAAFVAIAWPAFWWLDYYVEFRAYLCRQYHQVLKNDRLVIFDLKS